MSSAKPNYKNHLTHSSINQNEAPKSESVNHLTQISIQRSSSCPHLSELRTHLGSNPFRTLQHCLKVGPLSRVSLRRDPPEEVIRCRACTTAPARLYACITCAEIFCRPHAPLHAHALAVDVDRAELFCGACVDQVYDRDFDASVVSAAAAAAIGPVRAHPPPENLSKRRRVDYKPWAPDLKEQALITENSIPLPTRPGDDPEVPDLPWGLRGLNNLGNTCFMNSVMQALLHTPPLRNFFLSDKHNRYYCQKINTGSISMRNKSNNKSSCNINSFDKNLRLCLACDLDAMFSAFFSGDRTPYSPAKFLYSWWQHASNLASYEQQDAHEFFISMLDGIHEKLLKDKHKAPSQGSGECCIAHRVFSGILRSDVMCTACGFTSTTYDPCIDISLDLETDQGGSLKVPMAKSHHPSNGDKEFMNSSPNSGMSTLKGCLDRFTRPERLGSDQKFFCQQCQIRQESLKQMSIRKLPLVSCFHIKRFEHSPIRKMSRKVDRYLQFPFSLDMAPYLSSSILRSRFGNRMFSSDGDKPDSSGESSSEFELFAVITHSGKLDAGHYTTYLRLSNQWYKCDDAWITRVNENTVRAAQGYMIFYVQKMLYYKASEQ